MLTKARAYKVHVDVPAERALERVREKLAALGAVGLAALGLDEPLVLARVDAVRESDGLLVSGEQEADLRNQAGLSVEPGSAELLETHLLQHTSERAGGAGGDQGQ